MAFVSTLGWLAAVLVIALIAIAFGARVLRFLGVVIPCALERALLSAGISFAMLQVVTFTLLAEGWMRRSVLGILLSAMALAAGNDWKIVSELLADARNFYSEARKSRLRLATIWAIAAVLMLDSLMAMAPLTGSDALHYHFTVPALWLRDGFRPLYDIITSFGVGQSHMLIALGMALGSDHVALELIFLGGAFSAAALYCLARNWISLERSLIATLVFLLSPIAFWQMTVAGAPDIWMMFYTTVAVLAAARCVTLRSWRWAVVAGFLAGAAGGSKYPSLVIPATLAIVFLIECRSIWIAAISSLASFLSGAWPLLRNAWWTGDPFFPYASKLFKPHTMNSFTLTETLTDTYRVPAHHGVIGWLEYPFRMVLDGQNFGVGHYFGPLVLILAPLLLLAYRPTPLFRVAAWIWAAMFLSNLVTSQMGRFLLPVFGIALAIVFAGVDSVLNPRRTVLRFACNASVVIFLLFGAASFAAYGRDFLPVSMGLESREHFLGRMAPNYQEISFANSVLAGKQGVSLVFFQHLYYLQIKFMVGDPTSNWNLYPEDFSSPDAMLKWLRSNDVRWIVKAPQYAAPVRASLEHLESEGFLRPIASAQTEDFAGWRIAGEKFQVKVIILEVRLPEP